MNLVSLLPIKFTKKCERVFALLFGQNKTKLPICRSRVKQSISNNRTERKMPRQFESLLRRPKKEQTSKTDRNVKLLTIVVGVLTGISLVKIASLSRIFLRNELSFLPEKTTGSVDLLLSTSTNQLIACRNRVGSINYFS